MAMSNHTNEGAGTSAGCLLRVKVVPGARKEGIAGTLGDRIKIRVSAPPEDGKANLAVCRVVAEALGIRARQVCVESGHTNPEKTLRIEGVGLDAARAKLNATT